MTTFKRDLQAAIDGDYQEVITRRRNELKAIDREGRICKNKFRMECLAQDYRRLSRELDAIIEAVEASI